MVKIYSPNNEMDLAFLKSMFESEGISFFVHNDNYGSLKVGPRIDLLNAKTIFVHESYAERARELISDYLKNTQTESFNSDGGKSSFSILDKIRIVVELLVFGWFIPGKRWRKSKKQNW